ncbi:MAG TPA: 2,3-diphosphoglycerate-dependent phosphoglycerate mutase [Patescibacteria group bacterium]|nr:2,3-diphosphoglycerate-dependent phosphoglycerate mutase [Patescibacteria group bacterium]
MAYLVLVRHGLSEYNKKGLWCGWIDPSLVPEGVEQAQKTGEELKDIEFDLSFTSILRRAKETLDEVKKTIGQTDIPTTVAWELNERNYGDFSNKNKWQVKEEVGEEVFQQIRRSWDYPIPSGESLKEVYERALPYYQKEIEPQLKNGKNIIIASSGNALRALVKYLENIPEDKISGLEIGTGEAYVYQIDSDGKITNKEIRGKNPLAGKV